MSWVGQSWAIRSRISASDLRSAIVTRSASPLYSTLTCWRKYSISSAPASRAISAIAGRKSLLFEGDVIRWEVVLSQTAPRRLPALGAVLCDIHDFVFENEKIRPVFTRQPDHVLIVIFNPAVDDFAVGQFDPDRLLFLPQRLQIRGLLRCFLRRSALGFPRSGWTCLSVECHNSILHVATGWPLRMVQR